MRRTRPTGDPTTRVGAATLAIGTLAALTLAGCSTGTDDFRVQTEDYLNDSRDVEGLVDGADVSNAECAEPQSTDIGSRYACTADVDGLGTLTFDAEIDAEDSFFVRLRSPLDTAGG